MVKCILVYDQLNCMVQSGTVGSEYFNLVNYNIFVAQNR